MIRPLTLTDSLHYATSEGRPESLATRTEVSAYLYLVADCLTVVFYESDSLGLSETDLMDTANRYLDEARISLEDLAAELTDMELPSRLRVPEEIPVAATELSRQAKLIADVGS